MFAKFEKKNIEEILFKQTTWIVVGKVFFFQYKSRLSCSETKTRPSIDNFRLLTDQNVSNQCFLFVFVISSLTMFSHRFRFPVLIWQPHSFLVPGSAGQ